MNCLFCHARPGDRALSKEHVFSKPVRRAFGIADDTTIGRVSLDGVVSSFAKADQFQVRLPCHECNSGWMSTLEVGFVRAVQGWRRGDARIGSRRCLSIARWALKSYIVLSAIEGDTRSSGNPGETPPWRVMPEATRGRQLRASHSAAFDGVKVGIARIAESQVLYGFGNPRIESPHGGLTPFVSAGTMFVVLDGMVLWVVVAFDTDARIDLPAGVSVLSAHSRWPRIRYVKAGLDPGAARVVNTPRLDMMAEAIAVLADDPDSGA